MPGKARRVIRKYYEYFTTKVKLVFSQKKFKSGDVTLKYILKKNSDSKDLVVVFSSCTRRGIKARYNYMRTLAKVNANKLFILDDFAADHRGSYYLGYDQTYSEEKATIELINHIKKSLGTDKLICCGSSKPAECFLPPNARRSCVSSPSMAKSPLARPSAEPFELAIGNETCMATGHALRTAFSVGKDSRQNHKRTTLQ